MIIKKRSEILNDIATNEKPPVEKQIKEEKVNFFDLDNINFAQRQERRRGDRRRGYRRIDDRNLISRAQEEAGIIRDSAAQEGYKLGIERAQEDIAQVRSAIEEFMKAKQEVFEFIAPDILEISIDIARKIVKHEIEQNPQTILDTILGVLKTISRDEARINLIVNSSQVDMVKANIPEMVSSIGLETKTNVIADDTIELGGCIIQTSNGVVDATIKTQLEIIREAFKGSV